MCKHPYMRGAHFTRFEVRMDKDNRTKATPFPCGRCLPCRINRARVWTHRLLLEQLDHEYSYFITLTYDNEHLPKPPNVRPREITLFMKRIRKNDINPVRYFAVGEYGSISDRPHYHLIMYSNTPISSEMVEKAWNQGFVYVGDLTKDSARYITGYCVKKLTKKENPKLHGKDPEFMRSSKQKGGIGLSTIIKIATKIRQDRNYDPETSPIIRTLNHGKKELPLGRYLTQKLNDALGVRKGRIEAEFYIYQEQIFDQHLTDNNYYFNVADEMEPERISQAAKQKLFNQRKTL